MSNNNIALTASMRSNLLSLQNTQSLMNKTQDRLSTGYKVNSAMDNPSSYFTAQALNSRANDLSSLLDSIGQAISTLEVADEGITTLQDFVEQAKSIANSARDTSNVSASSTSSVKFNTDTLRSDLVTNQVNGLTPGNSSMTIRLGDATKLDGLTNVSEETALSNLGIGTTGASDIGTLSIDGKAYTIDASGSTKQMTNVSSYGEKSVLKITDGSNLAEAKVEDAAGNKYTLDLTGVTGIGTDSKQIKVRTGMEGGIKATVAEDGKTTWELSDKNAWSSPAEKSKTSTWSVVGTKFKVGTGATTLEAGDGSTIASFDGKIGDIQLQENDIVKSTASLVIKSTGDEFDTFKDEDGLQDKIETAFANAVVYRNLGTNASGNISTDTYNSGSVFEVTDVYDEDEGVIGVKDESGKFMKITVTDARLSNLARGDLLRINTALTGVNASGDDHTGADSEHAFTVSATGANADIFKDALIIKDNASEWTANAATRTSVTTTPTVTRPSLDLTGSARDIKGTYTYTIAASGTATFGVSEYSSSTGTVTLTDKDGNVFKNVKVTASSGTLDDTTTDITITNGSATSAMSFSISKAENDTIVASFNNSGSYAISGNVTSSGNSANAQGTMVQANTVFIDNGGTVGDMAETLQNMIGNTRLSVTVEDSNLKLKTLDTSSLEVKDGSVLGTNGTANGVGFATAFGLDVGQTIKLDADDTAESLRQKVEQMSRNMRDGRSVTAEFDQNGHMVIKSSEGDDMVISGELADRLGVSGKATNGSNERAIYSQQFNNVLTQIDQLVQDTSYKGINLLKGDNLTVNFNESRTSTIELKGVNFDATGLGFTQAVNEWRTNANIDKSLEQITKATSMLRAQASEFGQNLSTVQIREDFTKNMINNLQSGADKLTLADMNEEAANMLALQTRQQLGVNSLSLASQASQSVLKLF